MSKVATFYQYYYKDIFNYVYNLLNDIDAAQEIVQETFTCLCENVDMDDSIDQKKVKVWALEKVHYLAIKYLQKVDDVLLNSIKVTSNIWSREILEEKIQTKALREFIRSMLQEI
ncbi:sigma factor [Robertmurraya sp. DFI.2.37]|uniref:RNA polymerase sigma factor n=1 Tax=Robertmurraya sp. DFI.2.37 TaxID=3031819 RepID=UPI0023DA1703|nr:sigma factor [Robertmurraya sp. DFI.2.37]MDF1510341.1 sigma factor [Robertmurraya sp. DFI.2.37]